jgi:hypothetical protein
VPVPADMGDEREAKPLDQAVMITADDIAELVVAVTRLSRWTAVPRVAVTRPRLHLAPDAGAWPDGGPGKCRVRRGRVKPGPGTGPSWLRLRCG